MRGLSGELAKLFLEPKGACIFYFVKVHPLLGSVPYFFFFFVGRKIKTFV